MLKNTLIICCDINPYNARLLKTHFVWTFPRAGKNLQEFSPMRRMTQNPSACLSGTIFRRVMPPGSVAPVSCQTLRASAAVSVKKSAQYVSPSLSRRVPLLHLPDLTACYTAACTHISSAKRPAEAFSSVPPFLIDVPACRKN